MRNARRWLQRDSSGNVVFIYPKGCPHWEGTGRKKSPCCGYVMGVQGFLGEMFHYKILWSTMVCGDPSVCVTSTRTQLPSIFSPQWLPAGSAPTEAMSPTLLRFSIVSADAWNLVLLRDAAPHPLAGCGLGKVTPFHFSSPRQHPCTWSHL